MLSYAFTTLDQGGYEDIAKESFDHFHNLFAAILAKGIGRQLKQGLYREYVNHIEEAPVVRGKINMPGTIQNRLARKQMVTCEYDELSENNLLNQILKTTVMLLLCHADVDQAYKNALKKEMLFFSNVDTVDPITPAICTRFSPMSRIRIPSLVRNRTRFPECFCMLQQMKQSSRITAIR